MIRDERPDWEALARHVAGECSDAEAAEVEAWAATRESHRASLETAQRAWAAAAIPGDRWDVEAALSRVKASRGGLLPRRLTAPKWAAARPEPGRFRRMPGAGPLAIAAVLAGVGFLGVVGFPHLARSVATPDPVAVRELVTEKGERARVGLSDGTQVLLGPGSRVEILSGFGVSTREVRLTGEAYFDVARDAARPFLVHVRGATTRVLGTQFGIRAYPDEPSVKVVVAEGRVSVRPLHEARGTAAAILQGGQMGELTPRAGGVTVRPADVDVHLAWRDGRLTFENAPLAEVVREIERWYGIPVRVGDPSLGSRRLTASFRDQPVEVVLEIVAASLEMEWTRVGQTYVFSSRKAGRLAEL